MRPHGPFATSTLILSLDSLDHITPNPAVQDTGYIDIALFWGHDLDARSRDCVLSKEVSDSFVNHLVNKG